MAVCNSRMIKSLEQQMSLAETYEEWFELAQRHDIETGAEIWCKDDRSTLFDYYNINTRLQNLRRLASDNDDHGLLFALNEGIHGNMAGMGNAKLYQHAKSGTKHLIEDYVAEICDALEYLSPAEFPGISWNERHEFFKRASHCYGRSALMLSGGGTLGYFHLGVLKALIEQQLCPVVISGASAGACVAAIIGTHSDGEFLQLFEDNYLAKQLAAANARVIQLSDGSKRVDTAVLQENLSGFIPDMTFLEAYEKTGRSINISISPAEPRQNSRLLNHIASPNVTIHSAVLASSALPGVLPPVQLQARDAAGNIKPYLPSRRWIDGTFSQDLPAKRLARIYSVNHFIVSQVMPGLGKEPSDNSSIHRIMWVAYLASVKQFLRSSMGAMQRFRSVGPALGTTLNALNSLLDQRFTGDINIFPSYGLGAVRKMMKVMTAEELAELIRAGERATWPKLPMIEMTTCIGRTLDGILLNFESDETHWLRSAPKTDASRAAAGEGIQARRKASASRRARPAPAKSLQPAVVD